MKGAFRRIATFLIGCFALAAGIVILVYSLKEREFVNNFVPKTCKTISVTGRECMNNIIGSYSQAMITAQSCENNVYTQMGCTCQANSCDCSGGTYGEVNTYWWKVLTLVGAISTGLMGLYMLFASYLALSNSAGQVSVRIFSVLSGFLFIIFAAVGAAMIYLSVYIEKDSTFNTDQSCLMKSPAITAEVQAENCIIEVQCKTIKDLKSSMKTILYELGIPFLAAGFFLLLGTFACCCCAIPKEESGQPVLGHPIRGEQKGEIVMHANPTAQVHEVKEEHQDVFISMPSAPEL